MATPTTFHEPSLSTFPQHSIQHELFPQLTQRPNDPSLPGNLPSRVDKLEQRLEKLMELMVQQQTTKQVAEKATDEKTKKPKAPRTGPRRETRKQDTKYTSEPALVYEMTSYSIIDETREYKVVDVNIGRLYSPDVAYEDWPYMEFEELETEVRESTVKGAGKGLFAKQLILKNYFIMEYKGAITTHHSGSQYSFKMMNEYELDAETFGNDARYINSSQGQKNLKNCRAVLLNFAECGLKIFIQAIRSIRKDEELFFDYAYKTRKPKSERLA